MFLIQSFPESEALNFCFCCRKWKWSRRKNCRRKWNRKWNRRWNDEISVKISEISKLISPNGDNNSTYSGYWEDFEFGNLLNN